MKKRTPVYLAVLLALFPAACREPGGGARPGPMIVIGIDGGEWRVIQDLWSEGQLLHLRELARRGVHGQLMTRYGASPVIWTTIATGRRPRDHGITDFVVPTPRGDVPVSSTVRRVPAIWNMLSLSGRKVAVLNWWATWPAEKVRGLVVSDRALAEVDRRVYPPGFLPDFRAAVAAAEAEENLFVGNDASRRRDQVTAYLGRQLAAQDYDLLLVYFRSVDISSHNYWKHYRPQDFAAAERPSAGEIAAHGEAIPRDYLAVDAAIGRIVAARPDADVVVISDHGFEAAEREIVKVGLDFDGLLERLGYLVRDDAGGVDLERSQLYSFASPEYRAAKWLRFAGGAGRRQVLTRLAEGLARVTYGGGKPAFAVREPRAKERRREVDLVVEVLARGASEELLLGGDPEPLAGLVTHVARVSGTHGSETHGIFLAAGPGIDPAAEIAGITIHDIAPTLLYGLGLPVAESFPGRAWVELFTGAFRRTHPLRTIATWGEPGDGAVTTSGEDEEILRELRALGYLD